MTNVFERMFVVVLSVERLYPSILETVLERTFVVVLRVEKL